MLTILLVGSGRAEASHSIKSRWESSVGLFLQPSLTFNHSHFTLFVHSTSRLPIQHEIFRRPRIEHHARQHGSRLCPSLCRQQGRQQWTTPRSLRLGPGQGVQTPSRLPLQQWQCLLWTRWLHRAAEWLWRWSSDIPKW